jgi:pyruvate, orthophosphate dikinase
VIPRGLLLQLRDRLTAGDIDTPVFGRPEDASTYAEAECLVPGLVSGRLFRVDGGAGGPGILVSDDCTKLPLSALADCDGVIIGNGDATSHFVIRARHLGIPTVRVGLQAFQRLHEGLRVTVASAPAFSLVTENPVQITREPLDVRSTARELRSFRSMRVLANIDTSDDAVQAAEIGLDGVGMWRTENSIAISFANDREVVYKGFKHIFGASGEAAAADDLGNHLEEEFVRIAESTWPQPFTVRLLDTPLENLLGPDRFPDLRAVRGVRLGVLFPNFLDWQLDRFLSGFSRAARTCKAIGPFRLLLPMVVDAREVTWFRSRVVGACRERGLSDSIPQIGVTVETPRAALTIDAIARVVDFLSLGTNDLTQFVWVVDRDEAFRVIGSYLREGILTTGPYHPFDRDGVGSLLADSITKARGASSSTLIGVSGELGAESMSAGYLEALGIDYVTVSPGIAARVCIAHSLSAALDSAMVESEE